MRIRGTTLSMAAGLLLLLLPTAASARTSSTSSTSSGYDVSYPQCGSALPASAGFGIVGVNDGIVYSPNPCLASQYRWADTSTTSTVEARVSFYANTADPGPSSGHWPLGQLTPQVCVTGANYGCDYDYGWNAANDSYQDAVGAAGATAAQGAPWWLDVESANSWNDGYALNTADLQGAADALDQLTGHQPGFYTNSSSWQSITGSTRQFSSYEAWLPGARTLRGARSNCAATAPTGGTVYLSQYSAKGLDADYDCR